MVPIRRRDMLKTLGSLAFAPFVGCLGGGARLILPLEPAARTPAPSKVDDSFAVLALRHLETPQHTPLRVLLTHPALDMLERHQHMSGNRHATKHDILQTLLLAVKDPSAARATLAGWHNRGDELLRRAQASDSYLPSGWRFHGTLYLIVGYDIGIAAPPDIAINVDHPHFAASPQEVAHYVTHEAHHLGFLDLRQMPALENLENPATLRRVVQFMTQMEGLAVHSVFALRRDERALGDDADYVVYVDPKAAKQVVRRYDELFRTLESKSRFDGQKVGTLLTAMSSGGRLWYRFGALVAAKIEREQGRKILISSIEKPHIFWEAATKLLESSR